MWSGGGGGGGGDQQLHEDAGVGFSYSHLHCGGLNGSKQGISSEGMGRIYERRSGLRWFRPLLRLQNVSNYLHLPPTNLCEPSGAFHSSHHPRCRNYPNAALSPPKTVTSRRHPPATSSPGFRHPPHQHIRTETRVEKTPEKKKGWGWAPEMSQSVMKSKMLFMQRHVTSLCTKGNLPWMEQQVCAISAGTAVGGSDGLFDVLYSDAYGKQFWKKLPIIQTGRQMESHTYT